MNETPPRNRYAIVQFASIAGSLLCCVLLGLRLWGDAPSSLEGVAFGLALCVLALQVASFAKEARNTKAFYRSLKDGLESFPTMLDELKRNRVPIDPLNRKMISEIYNRLEKRYAEMILQREAKLCVLQSQINPHFLYNTLDAIRSEVYGAGFEVPAEMLHELASFFRYSISEKKSIITLREELRNVDTYMNIMRYRFDNRFILKKVIDETDDFLMDFRMPKMILQPLIENAINHGLEPMRGDGQIVLHASHTNQYIEIVVQDSGVGIDEASLQKIRDKIYSEQYPSTLGSGSKHGIALANVNKRLMLFFGEKKGISITSAEGLGTEIHILMPVTGGKDYEN